jgi:xanthine dehydrogenase accessory factor
MKSHSWNRKKKFETVVIARGNPVILIKGAGEKASAVACFLHKAGFERIVMTDLPSPMSERRGVCFSEALYEEEATVEGLTAVKASFSPPSIQAVWEKHRIAVLPDPDGMGTSFLQPRILIDAVMAKKNTGTRISDAPWVIALGPGFEARRDAHMLVETDPNSDRLGSLLEEGRTRKPTGVPSPVEGLTRERIIRSPACGILYVVRDIGEVVRQGETIGFVKRLPVEAPMFGVIWGFKRPGVFVRKGQKLGDIDPRGDPAVCFRMSSHSILIARAVLRAVRTVIERY